MRLTRLLIINKIKFKLNKQSKKKMNMMSNNLRKILLKWEMNKIINSKLKFALSMKYPSLKIIYLANKNKIKCKMEVIWFLFRNKSLNQIKIFSLNIRNQLSSLVKIIEIFLKQMMKKFNLAKNLRKKQLKMKVSNQQDK